MQRELFIPFGGIHHSQYSIFSVVGSPATIFNFNLDGLAARYCARRHIVLEPHGTIDRFYFEDPDRYRYALESVTAYDVTLPTYRSKVLPSPELSGTVETAPYRRARSLFSQAPGVVIVGYSFANMNGVPDDAESWEYFVDLLKRHPKPVFVLDPFPHRIAELLCQAAHAHRAIGLEVRWEEFATVLISSAGPGKRLRANFTETEIRQILYRYDCEVGDKKR